MLKRTIAYKDLDGNELVDDFYFNLRVDEVAEMELDIEEGALTEHWLRLIKTKNAGGLLKSFRKFIANAYGIRAADNVTFEKTSPTGAKLGSRFVESTAYSALFMELLGPGSTDSAMFDFIRGVMPPELVKDLPEDFEMPTEEDIAKATSVADLQPKVQETFTHQELMAMSKDEFTERFGDDSQKWSQDVLRAAFARRSNDRAELTSE